MKKIILASLVYSAIFPSTSFAASRNDVMSLIDELSTSGQPKNSSSSAKSAPLTSTKGPLPVKSISTTSATPTATQPTVTKPVTVSSSTGSVPVKATSVSRTIGYEPVKTMPVKNAVNSAAPVSSSKPASLPGIDEYLKGSPSPSSSQSTTVAAAPVTIEPVTPDIVQPEPQTIAPQPIEAPVVADISSKKTLNDNACLGAGQGKGNLSFYDVVVMAMCNDPKAKATWLNLHQYQIAKDSSYAGYMPTVDLNSSFGHRELTQTVDKKDYKTKTESWANTLELSWLLFDFGQREASVDKAKSELIAVEFLSLSDLQDVVLDAAQKYFAVIASEAYLEAARDIEVIAYKSLQVTQGKREAGVGELADELQAKNAALSATNYRIKAEGEVRNSMGALASILGKDITKDISFQKGLSVPSQSSLNNINQLIEKALNQHPQLLAAKEQITVSEKELSVAKRGFLPSVYFTSRWGNDRPKYGPGYDSDELYMGVNVKVPLFSGFSQYNAVRAAQNKLELTQNQFVQTKQNIALQVWQTYQRLSTAQNNLKNMRDLVASSSRAYEIARGRYQSGVGSILELLNTQNDLSEAQINNVNTMVDWHLARLSLASSLGQLNVSTIKSSTLN
ncbi:TolC family protein [Budviciaceae bacterium BWR-B9]|uniref:TolC family protein n=1 Tax=Limnobaculum allomyrinae TaxID=2791986 RepID=A0ABS1IL61_9GAMM|nr:MULTISPECIES: TolC family protein [Limnobaculum]MBK5142261.1 TolC family protein [Limnobaculum allomyrinae]MBV7690855.1 TolC family protein [Limnobaculum sp. M2-1]